MNLLTAQVNLYCQFSIEFVNVSSFISEYNLFVSRHITIEAYFRFFIPYLLSGYEKVIYLDCDMIADADIAELIDVDIGDNILAATRDVDVVNECYKLQETNDKNYGRNVLRLLKNPYNYFCDGLCVFSIKRFRKTMNLEDLFKIAMSSEWDFHDQDVLNIATEGKTYFLSWHWGVYNAYHTAFLPENIKSEYEAAVAKPKIVHFVGIKPWKTTTLLPYSEWFWKYATRTPFIGAIFKRMEISSAVPIRDAAVLEIINKRLGFRFILRCIVARLFRSRLAKKIKIT